MRPAGDPLLAHVSVNTASVDPELLSGAIGVLVAAIGGLIAATVLVDRRGLLPRAPVTFGRWSAALAAALSVGAATIHFAVVGEHFAEYPPYGVAFAALGWFQVGWAVAWVAGGRVAGGRVAGRRSVALVAIAVNSGALVVWATSRLVGLPIGPEPGEQEPIGTLDLVAGLLEVGLVALLALDLGVSSDRPRPALPAAGAAVVVGSGVLAVIVLTSGALAAVGDDAHGGAAHDALAAASAAAPPVSTPSSVAASSSPTSAASPAGLEGGAIRFGTSLDLAGEIDTPAAQFRPGESAVWIADFAEPPEVSSILLVIVQVVPDGREFEHWRQEISLVDPQARRLVAGADLSIYVHGGEGSYRMRYLRGEELLAEGAFEFVP